MDTISTNPTEQTTEAADSRFLPNQLNFLSRILNPVLDSVTGLGVQAISQKLGVAPATRQQVLPERTPEGGTTVGLAGPMQPDNIPMSSDIKSKENKGFLGSMNMATKVGIGAGAVVLVWLIAKKL